MGSISLAIQSDIVKFSMIFSSTFLSIIFSLTSVCYSEKVNTCIMCTSDSTTSVGDNIECRENAETQPNGECSAEFGNDYCYVLVTRQKQPTASWQWNRGCCTPKAGSQICPLNGPNHESNEVYEMWRARCDEDDCNVMNPRTSSGGGGDFDEGLVVPGKSGARRTYGNLIVMIGTMLIGIYMHV